jgi:predicted Zn-dependent protease
MANKSLGILLAWMLMVTLFGCLKEIQPEEQISADPREKASLQLTEEGRRLLENGKPDNAIRILEQSVSLDPDSGQNYYYLAEAWLMKANPLQAREFNRLAEIKLKGDEHWMPRIARQADRIAKLEK